MEQTCRRECFIQVLCFHATLFPCFLPGVRREEFVIYDPDFAAPEYLIEFSTDAQDWVPIYACKTSTSGCLLGEKNMIFMPSV